MLGHSRALSTQHRILAFRPLQARYNGWRTTHQHIPSLLIGDPSDGHRGVYTL